jgi:hypothetical protein
MQLHNAGLRVGNRLVCHTCIAAAIGCRAFAHLLAAMVFMGAGAALLTMLHEPNRCLTDLHAPGLLV